MTPLTPEPAGLYACVYATQFPAQAILRMRPHLRSKPCVVMQGEPPLLYVSSFNARAHALGVTHGMNQVEIDTFPSITVLQRKPLEESAASKGILDCVGAFSPRIEDRSSDQAFLCVVDIGGTEKLFGPPATLAHDMNECIQALGIAASIAVSGNFYTAVSMARGRSSRTGITVIAPGEERSALASLPLSVLDLSPEHAETFSLWGIHTLGMLAGLPESSLIARMGQYGKRLLQLARGAMPHLFQPIEIPLVLEETIELDTPVELLDSLLFVIGVMLEQLILRATAHILALASVTLALSLQDRTRHVRTVRPALPSNDRGMWIKLIHLDLEAHPAQAAILSLVLTAEPGNTGKLQLGLFSPQLPEPGRLDITLARIRAIVGEECVGRAVIEDTQRPDAFHIEPFRVPTSPAVERSIHSLRPAMRQMRPAEPVTLALRHKRPVSFFFRDKRYLVEHAYGPWLISGDWWNPTLWIHEQWDLIARSQDNVLLCCCITHDRTQNHWQLSAIYD